MNSFTSTLLLCVFKNALMIHTVQHCLEKRIVSQAFKFQLPTKGEPSALIKEPAAAMSGYTGENQTSVCSLGLC